MKKFEVGLGVETPCSTHSRCLCKRMEWDPDAPTRLWLGSCSSEAGAFTALWRGQEPRAGCCINGQTVDFFGLLHIRKRPIQPHCCPSSFNAITRMLKTCPKLAADDEVSGHIPAISAHTKNAFHHISRQMLLCHLSVTFVSFCRDIENRSRRRPKIRFQRSPTELSQELMHAIENHRLPGIIIM